MSSGELRRLTLASSVNNFNEAHSVIHDELLSISVFYRRVISLGAGDERVGQAERVGNRTHLWKCQVRENAKQ